jgi:hypothetical protein
MDDSIQDAQLSDPSVNGDVRREAPSCQRLKGVVVHRKEDSEGEESEGEHACSVHGNAQDLLAVGGIPCVGSAEVVRANKKADADEAEGDKED